MTTSIADIFEDYVESLQNLPSEIDQNMHELRSMDEEFQRFKEIYSKHRRTYAKLYKALNNSNGSISIETQNKSNPGLSSTNNLASAKEQIEEDYCLAIQKQDQKIELTKRMYELVNRHIERIDSQMAKSDLRNIEWIGATTTSESNSSSFGSNRTAITAAFTSNTDSIAHKAAQHPIYTSTLKKRHAPHHGNTFSGRKGTHHSSRPNPALFNPGFVLDLDSDPYEPKYCYCNQVSYGDMVACDGENCEKEWFHYACVGLTEPPQGKWYCDYCSDTLQDRDSSQERNRKKIKKEHTTIY